MEENRLKIIRDDLGGISQAQLASRTGIPLHKIKYAETGNEKISREIAQILDEKFGYNRLWVLTGEGEPYPDHGQGQHVAATTPIMPAYNGEVELKISDLLHKTAVVLESKTIFTQALRSNIEAFHHAITSESQLAEFSGIINKQSTQIASLQSQIDDLRRQVDRLTASPTTAAQQKAS